MSEAATRLDDDERSITAVTDSTAPQDAPVVPPEPAQAEPAPPASGGDDLDKLLAEYDQSIAKPVAEPEPAPEQPAEPEELDRLLADLDRQQMLANADPMLRAENEQARAAVENARLAYEYEAWRIGEQKAFIEECDQLQAKCPDWTPHNYVQDTLRIMALDDPRLEIAFQARNVNPVAARVEYDKTMARLVQLKLNPTANPQEVAALEQEVTNWGIAIHAKQILASAKEAVVKKARARPPVDEEASLDRAAVIHAVRGQSGPIPVEGAPDFGRMSDQELRDYTRNFGF